MRVKFAPYFSGLEKRDLSKFFKKSREIIYNGERHDFSRIVDHQDEVLETFVTKAGEKKAGSKFLKKASSWLTWRRS